jgi:hypothetical protein
MTAPFSGSKKRAVCRQKCLGSGIRALWGQQWTRLRVRPSLGGRRDQAGHDDRLVVRGNVGPGLRLAPDTRYEWRIVINDQVEDGWTRPFQTTPDVGLLAA